MKEVLEYEAIIRAAMGSERLAAYAPILLEDAVAIMSMGGRLATMQGSRKDQLREIAEQMKPYLSPHPAAEAPNLVAGDTLTIDDVQRCKEWLAANDTGMPDGRGLDLPVGSSKRPDGGAPSHPAGHSSDDDMFDGDDECKASASGEHHYVIQSDFEGREGLVYCEWCGEGEL